MKLFDCVEVIRDRPELGVAAGDQGAIVLIQAPGVFEVELDSLADADCPTVALEAADLRLILSRPA